MDVSEVEQNIMAIDIIFKSNLVSYEARYLPKLFGNAFWLAPVISYKY
jgi:hypothetical protein